MRILHTIGCYPPDPGGGGATEVVRQISERLVARGHEVTIATSYSPLRADGFSLNSVSVRQFNIYALLRQSVLGIRGDIASYYSYLRNTPFDIIMNYAAQTWHADLTYRLLLQLKARTVLCACGYSGLIGWRRLVYWQYFHRLPQYLRQYDAIVYHASDYRDAHFGAKHGITHFRIIPNGIDQHAFDSCTLDFRALYCISTRYLLLTVGDHYNNKGHKRILQAFRQLNRDDATLVIIGRNNANRWRSCWPACQREASRHTGRILLLNHAPRAHVIAAYKAADLFLSGSSIEAFPLVIIEAMASETPFVAFPAGNIHTLAGGLLVPTIPEMAAAVTTLLAETNTRRRLADEGHRQQQGEYDWERIVDEYEALYRGLLERPKRIACVSGAQS